MEKGHLSGGALTFQVAKDDDRGSDCLAFKSCAVVTSCLMGKLRDIVAAAADIAAIAVKETLTFQLRVPQVSASMWKCDHLLYLCISIIYYIVHYIVHIRSYSAYSIIYYIVHCFMSIEKETCARL